MIKLRLAILGAAAALALGTASVFAMTEGITGDPDAHGDAVASAARSCPHGASGVHGACVSAIASANGQAHRDGQQAARVKACRTANATSHKGFAACVSGRTTAGTTGS
jgi:hypothetical protein